MRLAGYLNHGNIEVLGQIILYCGRCSVHCRLFSNIPYLYPLDASSIFPKTSPDIQWPQRTKLSLVKDHQNRGTEG